MAMNLIWGMLNDLSFIISLTMVSLSIPGVAKPVMSLILQFIYLDLFQADLWLSPILQENNDDEDDDSGLNEFFEESGFQSMFMIVNLGSTFVFILLITMILLLQLILQGLSTLFIWFEKPLKYLNDKLYWNFYLRFMI